MKIITDLAMTAAILAAMAYRIIGGIAHEIIGIAALGFFVLHSLLNLRWYKNAVKGEYGARRLIFMILNLSLAVSALTLIVSGILHSKELFGLASEESDSLSRNWQIHALAAYWTFVLASVHLGFYWGTMVKRFWPRRSAPLGTILKISAAAAAIWGLYQCTERNIGSKLILYYSFDFWHTSEAAISYMASYLAIMVFFAFSAYYLSRIKSIFAKAPETLGRPADKAAEPAIFKNIAGNFYGTKAKKSLSRKTARSLKPTGRKANTI